MKTLFRKGICFWFTQTMQFDIASYRQCVNDYYTNCGIDVSIHNLEDIYTTNFINTKPNHKTLVFMYDYKDTIRRDVTNAIHCSIECNAPYVHIWIYGVDINDRHEDREAAIKFERSFNHHTISVRDSNDWQQRIDSIHAVLCPEGYMYIGESFANMFMNTDVALVR